jgi:hypothetical protein
VTQNRAGESFPFNPLLIRTSNYPASWHYPPFTGFGTALASVFFKNDNDELLEVIAG